MPKTITRNHKQFEFRKQLDTRHLGWHGAKMRLASRLVAVKVKLVNWLLIAGIIVNVNYDQSDAIELVSSLSSG